MRAGQSYPERVPVTVTLTIASTEPGKELTERDYLVESAATYELARDAALASVPEGWRAIALRS